RSDRRSVPVDAAPADRVLLPAELPGARHDRGLRQGLIGAAAPPPVTDPPPVAAPPPVTDGRSPVRGEGPGPADPYPGSLSSPPRSSPPLTPVYLRTCESAAFFAPRAPPMSTNVGGA